MSDEPQSIEPPGPTGHNTRAKIGASALATLPAILAALSGAGVEITFQVLALLVGCATLIVVALIVADTLRPMRRRKQS